MFNFERFAGANALSEFALDFNAYRAAVAVVMASACSTVAAPSSGDIVRTFHNETITSLHASRHTHVRVTGVVTFARNEGDGDVHFRLADTSGAFVVCEIVPYHPLSVPRLGEVVTVEGIHRYDNEVGHGWDEIHPVENIK